jgi:cytidylate kinase
MRPDQLVGKQMRRWEMDARVRDLFRRSAVGAISRVPAVTISRQLGSGGTHVARLVAKELGFPLYDKEIVEHVARLSGADPAQIARMDEHRPDFWGNLVLQFLEGKRPTEASYLRALVRALKEISTQGDAVILGRAATCILKSSFRVRIVCPEDLRATRIAGIHGVDECKARRLVMDSDRERHHFVHAFFGCDPCDCLLYDLVVNTERCTLDHAATLVVRGFLDRRAALREDAQPEG